jgi:hypothetical protein
MPEQETQTEIKLEEVIKDIYSKLEQIQGVLGYLLEQQKQSDLLIKQN